MEQGKIEKLTRRVSFSCILLLLFVPFLQDTTHFKTWVDPLRGSYEIEKDRVFDWDDWFRGDYQAIKDKYLKSDFGLHNYYVRLKFQLDYWLFKKANAAYVIVGKDDYLYEIGYIEAYYGKDFIGKQKIDDLMQKVKQVQDTLAKLNKTIIIALAPGKASFYPEYIPDEFKLPKKLSNYEYFAESAKRQNVNVIDFNGYYINQKDKSKYPLYPQFGIHWSNYASIMAFDSIVKYSELKTGVNLPDLMINSVKMSDTLQHTDDDVIKSMNLYFEPKTGPMAYPEYTVVYDSTKHKKLNLLVISDSFWWYIYMTKLPERTFKQDRFWYYNEAMYPESFSEPCYVKNINYFKKIREADVIVIMHSESTLSKFSNGFVDLCYQTYYKPDPIKEELQKIKESIVFTPTWIKEVEHKAIERNISVDSMLTLDAMYLVEFQKKR